MSYSRDPRKLTLKYNSRCIDCGKPLSAGSQAFYYPSTRSILGFDCCGAAQRGQRDFAAMRFDEEMLTGGRSY